METTIILELEDGGVWAVRDNGIFAPDDAKRYEILYYLPNTSKSQHIDYISYDDYVTYMTKHDEIKLHPAFKQYSGLNAVEVKGKANKEGTTTTKIKKKWWVYIGLAALAVVVITISLTVVMKRKKRKK